MIEYDPVSSLRASQVTVRFGGRHHTIRQMMADEWLEILFDPEASFDEVFPGLCDEDSQEFVNDLMASGGVGLGEVSKVAHDIISVAAGRPWWLAGNIVSVARQNWEIIGGELALAGVRADVVTLGAWLDAAYVLITRGVKPNQLAMVEARIKRPPMVELQADFDEETEAASFLAAMGAQVPG